MKIKKLLFISMLFEILAFNASAQMVDLMGSMAVGGAVNSASVNSIGMANNKLQSTQLASDIQMEMADVMMSYNGNYSRMKQKIINSGGHKVVFKATDNGSAVEAKIENVNEGLCSSLAGIPWEGINKFKLITQNGTKEFSSASSLANSKACSKVKDFSLIFK